MKRIELFSTGNNSHKSHGTKFYENYSLSLRNHFYYLMVKIVVVSGSPITEIPELQ